MKWSPIATTRVTMRDGNILTAYGLTIPLGTVENPILVRSAGDEQYAGCTGSPADSHNVIWLGMSRERPVERCPECGSVYKMEYVGAQDDGHDHGHDHHHGYEEPKTFANFVKPQYW